MDYCYLSHSLFMCHHYLFICLARVETLFLCLSNKLRFISKIYELMSERLILRVDENVNNQSWGTIKKFYVAIYVMRKTFYVKSSQKSLQWCVMYLCCFLALIKIYSNAGIFFSRASHGMQLYTAKSMFISTHSHARVHVAVTNF
jgi:hypothetical protein